MVTHQRYTPFCGLCLRRLCLKVLIYRDFVYTVGLCWCFWMLVAMNALYMIISCFLVFTESSAPLYTPWVSLVKLGICASPFSCLLFLVVAVTLPHFLLPFSSTLSDTPRVCLVPNNHHFPSLRPLYCIHDPSMHHWTWLSLTSPLSETKVLYSSDVEPADPPFSIHTCFCFFFYTEQRDRIMA